MIKSHNSKANKQNCNLIVIVIDALRAQNLSCYGYSQKTTPFIDSLAKQGIVFENFYANTDQTDPAFTSIFSGRIPITHGIIFHGNFITQNQINDLKKTRTRFLAELLKENYPEMVTIGIDWLSRWHKKGFDIYGEEEVLPGKKPLMVKYKWINEKLKVFVNNFSQSWYYTFNEFLKPFGFKYRNDAEGYFEYARSAINKYSDKQNFYLLVHLWDVHSPWNMLPKCYIRKFQQGIKKGAVKESFNKYKSNKFKEKVRSYHLKDVDYLSEVEGLYNAGLNYVDSELEKFVDFLKKEGRWNNTYLLITGDHGENLVVNDKFVSHMGTKNTVMKVPCIMVGPKLPQKRIGEMVQHIDLLPSILDLFDINTKYKYDGMNFLPLVLGEKIEWRDEIFFICSAASKRYTLLTNRFKYSYSPTEKDADDGVGGIWYPEVKELYDLKVDPDEKKNIVKEKPEVAELMEKRLNQILKGLIRKKERYILESSLQRIKDSSQ